MRVVLDVHLCVQNLDDVLASRHGHLQVGPAEAQVADGFEKTLDIQDKGNQTASAEVASQDQRTTVKVIRVRVECIDSMTTKINARVKKSLIVPSIPLVRRSCRLPTSFCTRDIRRPTALRS